MLPWLRCFPRPWTFDEEFDFCIIFTLCLYKVSLNHYFLLLPFDIYFLLIFEHCFFLTLEAHLHLYFLLLLKIHIYINFLILSPSPSRFLHHFRHCTITIKFYVCDKIKTIIWSFFEHVKLHHKILKSPSVIFWDQSITFSQLITFF